MILINVIVRRKITMMFIINIHFFQCMSFHFGRKKNSSHIHTNNQQSLFYLIQLSIVDLSINFKNKFTKYEKCI